MAQETRIKTKDIGKLIIDGLQIPIERPDGEPSGFGEDGQPFDIVEFDDGEGDPSKMTLFLDNGQRFVILVSAA